MVHSYEAIESEFCSSDNLRYLERGILATAKFVDSAISTEVDIGMPI